MAATNADLSVAVQERRFRQDLLFRLNACTFHIPPLRHRQSDIAALAIHFAACQSPGYTLSPAALERLMVYQWPGNVRELKNVIERAVLLCDPVERAIHTEHLPDFIHSHFAPPSTGVPSSRTAASAPQADPKLRGRSGADNDQTGMRADVQDYERERITRTLAATDGNLTRAAELLGLPRKTLAYRIEKLGIKPRS